jgi:hypothetical protein
MQQTSAINDSRSSGLGNVSHSSISPIVLVALGALSPLLSVSAGTNALLSVSVEPWPEPWLEVERLLYSVSVSDRRTLTKLLHHLRKTNFHEILVTLSDRGRAGFTSAQWAAVLQRILDGPPTTLRTDLQKLLARESVSILAHKLASTPHAELVRALDHHGAALVHLYLGLTQPMRHLADQLISLVMKMETAGHQAPLSALLLANFGGRSSKNQTTT